MRLILLVILLGANQVFSQTKNTTREKTFIKEYSYKASEMDSKYSCRIIAVNQIRSILLEEIGVYVETEQLLKTSEVGAKFSQDFLETITTVTAGITKLNVLDEKWDGETYWLKAEITVDLDSFNESLNQLINDRQKVKELEELRQELDGAKNEIFSLKEEAKKNGNNNTLQQKYVESIKLMDSKQLNIEGYERMDKKDYKGALEIYDQVIVLDPKNDQGYFQRGNCKRELGDNNGALSDYTKAIELSNPNNAFYSYANRGLLKQDMGDYIGAIDDLTKVIEANSQDHYYAYIKGQVYVPRGLAKVMMGDLKGALDDLNTAINKYHFTDGYVYRIRGIVKRDLKDYEGAINDYTQAIKSNPHEPEYYYDRSHIKYKANDIQGAFEDISKAIEISPIQKYYERRCGLRSVMNDNSGMIADLDELIKINPTNSDFYYQRAIWKINVSQKQGACSDLQRAQDLGHHEASKVMRKYCQ